MQLQMATSFLLRKPDKNNITIFRVSQKYRMRNLKGILGYMCARATPKIYNISTANVVAPFVSFRNII